MFPLSLYKRHPHAAPHVVVNLFESTSYRSSIHIEKFSILKSTYQWVHGFGLVLWDIEYGRRGLTKYRDSWV
ncbi:hypothetical protein TcasGA2_TC034497 [Tribolium castaneum]|uniref:Uncharacterized protein n=2 Tax=Tribolium castaneum TaxID=7070 RepID=A0A139W8M0_TRICA|nr:hypothetical protein TcasGA2_TC034497 [Tribolium castaneum]